LQRGGRKGEGPKRRKKKKRIIGRIEGPEPIKDEVTLTSGRINEGPGRGTRI